MPRLTKQLPKYRKHSSSGQAFVELNGRRHYLGPHNTKVSKQEYDRLVGEWLAGGRLPLRGSNDILLVELCLKYWEYAQGHYQKNGRCTRVTPGIKCALRYLKQLYSHCLASEFGPLALKAVREKMVQDGHSRRYINDHQGHGVNQCGSFPISAGNRFH